MVLQCLVLLKSYPLLFFTLFRIDAIAHKHTIQTEWFHAFVYEQFCHPCWVLTKASNYVRVEVCLAPWDTLQSHLLENLHMIVP